MKYRYIQFTDMMAQGKKRSLNEEIFYVGKPSEELICELELEVRSNYDSTKYKTTIQALGEKGWELQFVTPCGFYSVGSSRIVGPIENSYIFRKTEA